LITLSEIKPLRVSASSSAAGERQKRFLTEGTEPQRKTDASAFAIICKWRVGGHAMRIKLTEEIWKEGNMYVSNCPELDIAACGESVEQAKKNLKEVILINLEEAQKMGTLAKLLQEAGFDETQDVLSLRKELVGFSPIEVAI
jgi:predicted RNase H-like HicB family nuclease